MAEILILFIVSLYYWHNRQKIKTPFFLSKGKAAEREVAQALSQLDSRYFKVINDLMLPFDRQNDITQIDHLVVAQQGVFCIETKAHKGWIFGDAYKKYWTQVIYKHKEKFYNPIRQNYGHVKAVEELLQHKYPEAKVHSMIVFTNAGKIKVSGTDTVGRTEDIYSMINAQTNCTLRLEELSGVQALLVEANVPEEEARSLHKRLVELKTIKNS